MESNWMVIVGTIFHQWHQDCRYRKLQGFRLDLTWIVIIRPMAEGFPSATISPSLSATVRWTRTLPSEVSSWSAATIYNRWCCSFSAEDTYLLTTTWVLGSANSLSWSSQRLQRRSKCSLSLSSQLPRRKLSIRSQQKKAESKKQSMITQSIAVKYLL